MGYCEIKSIWVASKNSYLPLNIFLPTPSNLMYFLSRNLPKLKGLEVATQVRAMSVVSTAQPKKGHQQITDIANNLFQR